MITRLASQLTIARLKTRSGDAWLDVLAVVSFALGCYMALTVSGGVNMFIRWADTPSLYPDLGESMTMTSIRLSSYVTFAFIAAGLLVFPIFSLGASAARLGAQGRSRRLASLRLVGMTSSQTIRIALLETCVQWAVGAVIGTAAYFLALPAWHNVTFLRTNLPWKLMLLPAGYLIAILVLTLLIAVASTVVGLQRVRISPLGVAHRATPVVLRLWRMWLLPLGVLTFGIFLWSAPAANQDYELMIRTMAVTGLFLLVIMGGVSLLGPLVMRAFGHLGLASSRPAVILAMRRILADPRAAWRNVGALTILCFIVGFLASFPREGEPGILTTDIFTGSIITAWFAFAVSALSTLMNQASAVFDSTEQTRALSAMGFPHKVFSTTRIIQVLSPLLLTSVGTAALGFVLGTSTVRASGLETNFYSNQGLALVAVISVGVALTLIAVALCEPLERYVVRNAGRRND